MARRKVEVFTAGCPVCEPAVEMIQQLACPDCDITVHDLRGSGAELIQQYGIKTLPAVAVNGSLVGCCDNTGPDSAQLKASGIGVPMAKETFI